MAKNNLGIVTEMQNFENKKTKWLDLTKDENASHEDIVNSANEMFEALQQDIANNIKKEAMKQAQDNQILTSRGHNVLTSEETTFFNQVQQGLFTENMILPETTVNRIFEQLVRERPLLDALQIVNLGAVTRFFYADATRTYGWKDIFGNITGQANAIFREERLTHLKLTSYVVIPKDMLELGPNYIEQYVRTLIVESIGEGLEFGFVNGRGAAQSEPVGLIMDVDATTGAITPKTSKGTLTFAPSQFGETVAGELHGIVSALSVDALGESIDIDGKVVLAVNPRDLISVQFRNTIQTSTGQWVTALPYNIQLVPSRQVAVGKAVAFVQGRYMAITGGNSTLRKYDQTLALDDADLYTIKQFANGRPRDNNAALVYDLNVAFPGATPTPAP